MNVLAEIEGQEARLARESPDRRDMPLAGLEEIEPMTLGLSVPYGAAPRPVGTSGNRL